MQPFFPSSSDLFNEYQIFKHLYNSNFDILFLKNRLEKSHSLVLKLFPLDSETECAHFLREKAVQDLHHKNLIKIYQSYEKLTLQIHDKNFNYSAVLIEHCKHGDLADLISSDRLPNDVKLVRTIFSQIVEGVAFLHEKNFAHLDLKPENIVLGDDFEAKIIDFDSLCHLNNRDQFKKAGTFNYRAPEIRKKIFKDPQAADIFSLGVLLFVLLFRTFPFQEEEENENDLEELFLDGDDEFWLIHPLNGEEEVSSQLKYMIYKCVARNASERWTINELKNYKWMKGAKYSKHELEILLSSS